MTYNQFNNLSNQKTKSVMIIKNRVRGIKIKHEQY